MSSSELGSGPLAIIELGVSASSKLNQAELPEAKAGPKLTVPDVPLPLMPENVTPAGAYP